MQTPQALGRLTLLKHCLLFVGLALAFPIIFEGIDRGHFELGRAIIGFYKINAVESRDLLFGLVLVVLQSLGIWFFGGRAGRLLVREEKSKFGVGFWAMYKLWLVFVFATLVYQVTPYYGYAQLSVFMALLFGTLHSKLVGYFMDREIARKGRGKEEKAELGGRA